MSADLAAEVAMYGPTRLLALASTTLLLLIAPARGRAAEDKPKETAKTVMERTKQEMRNAGIKVSDQGSKFGLWEKRMDKAAEKGTLKTWKIGPPEGLVGLRFDTTLFGKNVTMLYMPRYTDADGKIHAERLGILGNKDARGPKDLSPVPGDAKEKNYRLVMAAFHGKGGVRFKPVPSRELAWKKLRERKISPYRAAHILAKYNRAKGMWRGKDLVKDNPALLKTFKVKRPAKSAEKRNHKIKVDLATGKTYSRRGSALAEGFNHKKLRTLRVVDKNGKYRWHADASRSKDGTWGSIKGRTYKYAGNGNYKEVKPPTISGKSTGEASRTSPDKSSGKKETGEVPLEKEARELLVKLLGSKGKVKDDAKAMLLKTEMLPAARKALGEAISDPTRTVDARREAISLLKAIGGADKGVLASLLTIARDGGAEKSLRIRASVALLSLQKDPLVKIDVLKMMTREFDPQKDRPAELLAAIHRASMDGDDAVNKAARAAAKVFGANIDI